MTENPSIQTIYPPDVRSEDSEDCNWRVIQNHSDCTVKLVCTRHGQVWEGVRPMQSYLAGPVGLRAFVRVMETQWDNHLEEHKSTSPYELPTHLL